MDTQKIRDEEMDLVVEALSKESRLRKEIRKKQIEKLKIEQTEFLARFQDLERQFIPVLKGVDTDKPLEKSYQLF